MINRISVEQKGRDNQEQHAEASDPPLCAACGEPLTAAMVTGQTIIVDGGLTL